MQINTARMVLHNEMNILVCVFCILILTFNCGKFLAITIFKKCTHFYAIDIAFVQLRFLAWVTVCSAGLFVRVSSALVIIESQILRTLYSTLGSLIKTSYTIYARIA